MRNGITIYDIGRVATADSGRGVAAIRPRSPLGFREIREFVAKALKKPKLAEEKPKGEPPTRSYGKMRTYHLAIIEVPDDRPLRHGDLAEADMSDFDLG